MKPKTFISEAPFHTESGAVLPRLEISYHTYGHLNAAADNVIWVCHALTANSDAADWWTGIIGDDQVIDPKKHFIVCANILASCYGSSGPLSINPESRTPYYASFPFITIRDMVKAHILLRKHLGVEHIHLCMGGSMGGYQVLEWSLMEPEVFSKLFLIATGASESAWGIAIHTAQRLAIEADNSWQDNSPDAGARGLKAARAIGMLTYRNYKAFVETQQDKNHVLGTYRAESYIHYQGEKLVKRFNAQSYHLLTRAMDSHHIGRNRGSLESTLSSIQQPTLVVGISSDQLCPVAEQQFLARHLHKATFHEIDSPYGHDGFLIEWEKLSVVLKAFV
ncbi:MAG TPA: homoserine O-acetyltransferase [Bacteroidia bacterium]|jgi:homoserine O-acetyltransferase|nr:homoserine O-acetyltransferase [Bacteroidia bacterium]